MLDPASYLPYHQIDPLSNQPLPHPRLRPQVMEMRRDVQDSIISCKLPLGSISIANRLSNPLTFVASFPNFWENASDRLCAGSVDYLSALSEGSIG
jgi:hypothetical protein